MADASKSKAVMDLTVRNQTAALISRAQVAMLIAKGMTGTAIGKQLGLCQQRISQLKTRFNNEAIDLLCDDVPVHEAATRLACDAATVEWFWARIVEKQGE